MKKELFIYLDGNSATLTDGTYLKWNIPDYYYKNVSDRDEIYITLENAQLMGTITTLKTKYMESLEVICSTNIRDYSNTKANNENVIGMFDCTVDVTNLTATCIRENHLKNSLFKVGKFTDFTILIRHQEIPLSFTSDVDGINKNNCKFMLKITYINDDDLKQFKSNSQPGSYYNGTEIM